MKPSWKVTVLATLIAGLSCISFPIFGQTITSFGGGNYDCGVWVKNNSVIHKAWLMGYLSGSNSKVAKHSYDPLGKLQSADQAFVWMDNFCQKNPLETVGSGADKLFRELESK
jgi:hypothetical protein